MTELEKIERARMYMDKLANGIDPIDDSAIPDGDVIHNVRLSRCFFFVSDVLRQVIENGGIKPAAERKRPKKLPLEIPFEQRSRFPFSEVLVTASEIAKRVNPLTESDAMKKLTYADILAWLTEIGMMEWAPAPGGKRTKRPTAVGEENGVSVEQRTSSNGDYQVVVYSEAAQHVIIDNLDAILALKNGAAERGKSGPAGMN